MDEIVGSKLRRHPRQSPCFQVPQKENSRSPWPGVLVGPDHSLMWFTVLGVGVGKTAASVGGTGTDGGGGEPTSGAARCKGPGCRPRAVASCPVVGREQRPGGVCGPFPPCTLSPQRGSPVAVCGLQHQLLRASPHNCPLSWAAGPPLSLAYCVTLSESPSSLSRLRSAPRLGLRHVSRRAG